MIHQFRLEDVVFTNFVWGERRKVHLWNKLFYILREYFKGENIVYLSRFDYNFFQ